MALVTLLTLAASAPARADELLVGALRDQDGTVVAGAAVAALDANGGVLAHDRSAPDGTFALSTPTRPVAVLINAPDADPQRVAVPADGSPVAAIVYRHRSVDLIPSVADVAAVPAGTLAQVASLVPYRVAFSNSITDRWLARGHGATTIEGLPFYRRGDGGDATGLLPSHALGGLGVRDPFQAPWYGDRAGGGVIDAQLFDRQDAVRATNYDAALEVGGRDASLLAATSWDPDGRREVLAGRATGTLGPVGANLVALVGDGPGVHYAGGGLDLRGATRTFDLRAHAALTLDEAAGNGPLDAGSVTDLGFDVTSRGADALEVHGRWRDERGTIGGNDGQHHDAALVVGTTRGTDVRVGTALALAYGDEYTGGTTSGLALLPSLTLDAPLGADWSFHAGAGAATLGTPGFGFTRSGLGEVGLAYADKRRLRADVIAFSEGDGGPIAVTRGFAAALGWEIAPRLSLRAWSLRDGDLLFANENVYPGGPSETVKVGQRFNRDVLWLTWDAPTRFDVLLRYGWLEGSVRVPLGARYALTAGTYRRSSTSRGVTFGVVAR
ncbi:MAG: hypothetical protein JO103_08360 [Candidatus Eremiobacteraeota bacterium]|nr:hypothetical protein [Candidatus Eremiobacteraeota bacterium]